MTDLRNWTPHVHGRRAVTVCSGGLLILLYLTAAPTLRAQTSKLPSASVLVSPAVAELRSTLAELRIGKWKAPGPVREEAEQNAGSITRDLDSTLPALVAQADTPPQTVANAFAVYRNLDALYEVVLRVSGTADLAASESEAASLSHALTTLDGARRSLADSILTASRAEDAALAQRQSQAVAAPVTAPAPTTVVDDGPVTATPRRKAKSKAAPKAQPATQP